MKSSSLFLLRDFCISQALWHHAFYFSIRTKMPMELFCFLLVYAMYSYYAICKWYTENLLNKALTFFLESYMRQKQQSHESFVEIL